MTPLQVRALHRELEAGRGDDDQPVEALIHDINQFPFIDFEKALKLVGFLAESDFAPDRTAAAFALPNLAVMEKFTLPTLAIEAEQRDAWATEVGYG